VNVTFGRLEYDVRAIQKLLRNEEMSMKMIYGHVLNRGGRGVRSRLDCHD